MLEAWALIRMCEGVGVRFRRATRLLHLAGTKISYHARG